MSGPKIGLLGGTFDPVHYGHLQLAEAASRECGLDQVFFIPAAEPPHKNRTAVSSFSHRLAMLELAIEGRQGFVCSAIEGVLPRPSYTIDTLKVLQGQYGSQHRLYFMIGVDAFLDILSWKLHQDVLRSVDIILAKRRGYTGEPLTDLLKKLGYTEKQGLWQADDGKRDIYIVQKIPDGQSSSAIRAMIATGLPVEQFLPPAVMGYINKNNLYK